ncbi:ABC transporter substrate-binding protein [Bradyrhizobium sp. sBnM-33]|uniref:ABC transporter substrate-binding protein n=1 Tax=Bradyrhizobium sp. sBnM-33 TaxID=2831780 RepID=UPI001BCC7695|nr:ABC transporter substrate-binding protein [Bradyrhizobium sp. sBnM-33]WOH48207.1 ABC transporter substrate-binding protein [Bradyrhizobium sp. sBnM-33]
MRRRELLSGSFALLLLARGRAVAEPSRTWRVAYVGSGSAVRSVPVLRDALRGLGYVDGKNLILEVREAKGNYSTLPDLMREAVSSKPDVIIAEATPAIAAAQKATSTIPIVMSPATDPIGSGFIKSFARPGGNITGVANMFGDLTAKTLDFLHLVLPNAKKIGVLTSNNPTHPPLFEVAKRGAEAIGISAERFVADTPNDLEAAFKAMKFAKCEAVYVLADPPRPAIPELSLKFVLPAIYQVDAYIQMGGLMSYGPDILAMFVKAAYYVDRIIKGANPSEMPVEQPATFRFMINLRTAKALGLTVPELVLLQADSVVE